MTIRGQQANMAAPNLTAVASQNTTAYPAPEFVKPYELAPDKSDVGSRKNEDRASTSKSLFASLASKIIRFKA